MKKLIVSIVCALFAVSMFSQAAYEGGTYGLPTKTAIRATDQFWCHKLGNVNKPDSFVGYSVLKTGINSYVLATDTGSTSGKLATWRTVLSRLSYKVDSSRTAFMTRKASDSLYLKISTLASVIGNTNIGGGDSITDAGGINARMILNQTLIYNQNSVRDISVNPQIVAGTNGQIIRIVGYSDTKTLKLDDGTGLNLSASITLGLGDVITLMYLSSQSVWIELNRSNN